MGGLDLDSRSSGCARLGGGVAPPLGVVVEEVAVLIVLVRRHRRAVGAAVHWAVDDEVPGARASCSSGRMHMILKGSLWQEVSRFSSAALQEGSSASRPRR